MSGRETRVRKKPEKSYKSAIADLAAARAGEKKDRTFKVG